MISSNVDPRLAAKTADTQDLARFKREMDGLKQNLSQGRQGGDTAEKLKEACRKFEAVFIGKLWEQMKQSVPKEGYLHSKEEDSYMSMFDRDFSEKMADAGGIGLADMIYAQLSQKLKQTSGETLSGGVEIKPLVPEPIALNRSGGGIPLNAASERGMTLEDWGGERTAGAANSDREKFAVQEAAIPGTTSRALSDVEVKARLDELTRRLEAERIREGLVGPAARNGKGGYQADTTVGKDAQIGRKLAEIG